MGNGKRREALDGLGQRRSNPCLVKVASVQAHQERDSAGVGRHYSSSSVTTITITIISTGAQQQQQLVGELRAGGGRCKVGSRKYFGGVSKDLGRKL